MDQQNYIISLIESKGLTRSVIFLFYLMIFTFILFPSNLLAFTQDESYGNNPSLISSVDPNKSAYFQNKLDKYLGIPYIRGGATEKGFDCSGFVRKVYMDFFGIELPHRSSAQSSLPFMQKVSMAELITGDLIFFSTTGQNKRINHVGIYLTDGRFIHAAKGGVRISSLDNSYWKARFFVAKRVGNDDIWNRFKIEGDAENGQSIVNDRHASLFHPVSGLNENLYASGEYPDRSAYSNEELSLGYEITWSASIANGSIIPKFTAFHKYRASESDVRNISSYWEHDGMDPDTASDRLFNQGVRFDAALGNNDGFFLTPSFTYYDTGYDPEKRRLQRFTYGLDLEISPDNKSWFFALGMKYSEYSYSDNLRYFNNSDEFSSTMNISFTYLHRLNESAYLSFTSGVGQRYQTAYEENLTDQWKNNRRSMFLFNINY